MTVLIVLAVIALILAVILLIPVSCRFYFRYNNEAEQELSVHYGFLQFNLLPRPDGSKEDKNPEEPEKREEKKSRLPAKAVISFIRAEFDSIKEMIYAVLGYMLKRAVKIKKLNIKFVLGLEDAMQTALIFGAASAFIYNVLGVMDKKMRLKEHHEEVKPVFNNPHIFAELEMIINTCILNVLITAVIGLCHALPIYKRFKKSREELV